MWRTICVSSGLSFPTFGIVKPAVTNTRVDMSPYGQSVFADAVDAVQAVDLTFDALINEIDLSKMGVFLSDVLFDRKQDGNKNVTIPFGKQDCTVFRKVMSAEDTIQEFAPALRASGQIEAFRVALQMLGDLTGFGISYFDMNESRGYVKTATEVSSDNSALMRNIRRHENSLEGSIVSIAKAVMHFSRSFGEAIPNEGDTKIQFDNSIIQDTATEKEQDMREVAGTMSAWEYRMRRYGEEESIAHQGGRGRHWQHREWREAVRALLGLELDPLAVPHELDGVAARPGDLDERVGARAAPTAYERGEIHAGLPEGLGGAHDALAALLAHVLYGLGDPHALCPSPQVYGNSLSQLAGISNV